MIRCKNNSDEVIDVDWVRVQSGWLPAICICNQQLYSNPPEPVDNGTTMTLDVVDLSISSNICDMVPNANRTIGRFSEALSGDVHLLADTSYCVIGDELVLIFSIDSSVNIIMPIDTFVFNQNYSEDDTFSITTSGNKDRWVLVFTFDGEKFVSSYEHC